MNAGRPATVASGREGATKGPRLPFSGVNRCSTAPATTPTRHTSRRDGPNPNGFGERFTHYNSDRRPRRPVWSRRRPPSTGGPTFASHSPPGPPPAADQAYAFGEG